VFLTVNDAAIEIAVRRIEPRVRLAVPDNITLVYSALFAGTQSTRKYPGSRRLSTICR
jgi:hypothetical protein